MRSIQKSITSCENIDTQHDAPQDTEQASELFQTELILSCNLLKNITDLPIPKQLFRDLDQVLIPGICDNLPLLCALLIVGKFLSHSLAENFINEPSKVRFALAKLQNTTYLAETRYDGKRHIIRLNNQLLRESSCFENDNIRGIKNYAFFLAIAILHEICHFSSEFPSFRSTNWVGDIECKQSRNCLERRLCRGKLGYIGKDFEIEDLLICGSYGKRYRDPSVDDMDQWFKNTWWDTCVRNSDFEIRSTLLDEKNVGRPFDKNLFGYERDLDRGHCATPFFGDKLLESQRKRKDRESEQ
jgi:hypothetical protein